MENNFETFKLKFSRRIDFEWAHKFVSDRHNEFDAGHSDMVLVFFSPENREEIFQLLLILGIKCVQV